MRISTIMEVSLLIAVGIATSAAMADPAANSKGDTGNSATASRGNSCDNKNLNQVEKFLNCVDGDDALVHLQALQDIADVNNGTRAAGTSGYDASADYVAYVLESAGYLIERQEFSYTTYQENSVSLSADGAAIETRTMTYSGSGEVSGGNVVAVDLDLGLGNASTSGCEADDFTGLDWSGPSDVALIQRGACSFATKAINAEAAGAEAVIIFNQGNTSDRQGIINGTLGGPVVDIPVLDVAYDDGVLILSASSIELSADTETVEIVTQNVIADLPGANPDNVVMAGAHLDSVAGGPGIQDNGSGSAALLAVALQLGNNTGYVPQNTLRFAFWGAEEAGLLGSFEYFTNPDFGLITNDPSAISAISSYLNFDMISSPNFIYGVYDADQSTFNAPVPVPAGSEELEDIFEAFYTLRDLPYEDSAFSGRSDYQVFILLDIPAGGLFTGAEGIKSQDQVAIWGGTAGEQYDPCYHLACDTLDNVSRESLDVNVDAVAYAVFNLAASTEAINSVPGVEVKGATPDQVVPNGPEGTFLGGGGLDDGRFSK